MLGICQFHSPKVKGGSSLEFGTHIEVRCRMGMMDFRAGQYLRLLHREICLREHVYYIMRYIHFTLGIFGLFYISPSRYQNSIFYLQICYKKTTIYLKLVKKSFLIIIKRIKCNQQYLLFKFKITAICNYN